MIAYSYIGSAAYTDLHNAAYALLDDILEKQGITDHTVCKDDAGRPFLSGNDINISLTHCGGLVACMTSEKYCGIDAEKTDRTVRESIIKRVCSAEELSLIMVSDDPRREFLRIWTLKEAYSKMCGKGMAVVREVSFPERDREFEAYGCIFRTYELNGHFLSVCERL